MRQKLLLISLLSITISNPAFAYLDPGTGSMLIYFIVGVFATLVYSSKELFYKITAFTAKGRGDASLRNLKGVDVVFYSEGGQYWNTFLPVIESLRRDGLKLAYYTSDENDPGLNEHSVNFTSKYIGHHIEATILLNRMEAKIVVMTTPQLDVMRLKRSKNVQHYVHLVHSPVDVHLYKKFAFDYFDSVMCSGQHQIDSIRTLEKKRELQSKQLFETGLTYYDVMLRERDKHIHSEPLDTVLVAPTWGKNGVFTRFGSEPIETLLKSGFHVIIRPHPQSYISEAALMKQIESKLENYNNLEWDRTPSPEASMGRADVLLSDVSGIVFDFFFIYQKPIVLIEGEIAIGGLEADDIDREIWEIEIFSRIATLANADNMMHLSDIVKDATNQCHSSDTSQILESSIFNFGKAGEVAAAQLKEISRGLTC